MPLFNYKLHWKLLLALSKSKTIGLGKKFPDIKNFLAKFFIRADYLFHWESFTCWNKRFKFQSSISYRKKRNAKWDFFPLKDLNQVWFILIFYISLFVETFEAKIHDLKFKGLYMKFYWIFEGIYCESFILSKDIQTTSKLIKKKYKSDLMKALLCILL